MLHFYIAAMVAGQVIAAERAKQRAALGLPPLPPPKPQSGDPWFFTAVMLGGCLVYAAPFAAFIFAAVKISFAVHGLKFP